MPLKNILLLSLFAILFFPKLIAQNAVVLQQKYENGNQFYENSLISTEVFIAFRSPILNLTYQIKEKTIRISFHPKQIQWEGKITEFYSFIDEYYNLKLKEIFPDSSSHFITEKLKGLKNGDFVIIQNELSPQKKENINFIWDKEVQNFPQFKAFKGQNFDADSQKTVILKVSKLEGVNIQEIKELYVFLNNICSIMNLDITIFPKYSENLAANELPLSITISKNDELLLEEITLDYSVLDVQQIPQDNTINFQKISLLEIILAKDF